MTRLEATDLSDTSTIRREDEADLSWFFGIAQSMFSRSTCGPILDHLRRSSIGTCVCRLCDGVGILEEEDQLSFASVKDEKAPGRLRKARIGDWCPRCSGTGLRPRSIKPTACSYCSKGLLPGGKQCPECLGTGIHQVTAQITSEAQQVPYLDHHNDQLTKLGIMSRRLSCVTPQTRQILAAFFGDIGAACGRTDTGRILSLYPLTYAGRTLLKRSQNEFELSETQRLQVEIDLQALQPRDDRGGLLKWARKQAEELYEAAARDWNQEIG